MLFFEPIGLSHKAIFEEFTHSSKTLNCDFAFANVYCWRWYYHTHISIYRGFLILRFKDHITGGIAYSQPVGEGDILAVMEYLKRDANSLGYPLTMQSLSEEFISSLSDLGVMDRYSICDDRDHYDYIYEAVTLRKLSGKKLQSKRNHINRFKNSYPNYTYQPIDVLHSNTLSSILARWQGEKGVEKGSIFDEWQLLQEAIANITELNILGGVLLVDDKVVAFTIASPINASTICVHIEKGDTEYEGSSQMINYLFANSVSEEFTMINREEDLGIDGLRLSKLSYNPTTLYKKFSLVERVANGVADAAIVVNSVAVQAKMYEAVV